MVHNTSREEGGNTNAPRLTNEMPAWQGFSASSHSIQALQAAAERGVLVQAHHYSGDCSEPSQYAPAPPILPVSPLLRELL